MEISPDRCASVSLKVYCGSRTHGLALSNTKDLISTLALVTTPSKAVLLRTSTIVGVLGIVKTCKKASSALLVYIYSVGSMESASSCNKDMIRLMCVHTCGDGCATLAETVGLAVRAVRATEVLWLS